MKEIRIALALFVFIFISACATSAPVPNKTFSNRDLGFSVDYPGDLTVTSEKVLFKAEGGSGIPILTAGSFTGVTFQEAIMAYLSTEGYSNIRLGAAKETTTADGSKAYLTKIEFTSTKGNNRYDAQGTALCCQSGNKWIVITLSTVLPYGAFNENDFSKVVRSLKIAK